MLKKPFISGVISLFAFVLTAFILPIQANAQSCCAAGYTFTNNTCVKDSFNQGIIDFCTGSFGDTVTDIANNFPDIFPETWRDDFPDNVCIPRLTSVLTSPSTGANAACNAIVEGITGAPSTFTDLYTSVCPAAIGALIAQHTDKFSPIQCQHGQSCDVNGQCVDQVVFIPVQICNYIADGGSRGDCNECFNKPDGGVYTPFGCIDTSPNLFIQRLLQIAISLAGGIAFLMILYGAFVTMTSAGNPERLNGGREIITSAIAGLLLIIFSTIILRIIGVDILQIPGF